MNTPLGRLYKCLVCDETAETWGGAVYHMMMHTLPSGRASDAEEAEAMDVAQILTTIRMREERVVCRTHPDVNAQVTHLCRHCVECLREVFRLDQAAAANEAWAAQESLASTRQFHVWAKLDSGTPIILDITEGLSEALDVLETVKECVEWAGILYLGRTVAWVREGKIEVAR